jgi:hypothetical protein
MGTTLTNETGKGRRDLPGFIVCQEPGGGLAACFGQDINTGSRYAIAGDFETRISGCKQTPSYGLPPEILAWFVRHLE